MVDRRDCCEGRLSAPPWAEPQCWRQINARLSYWIARRRRRLQPAFVAARKTAGRLQGLVAEMDLLCSQTCRHCPEPCCLRAFPWYDFSDLLLLNLLDEPISPGQILKTPGQPCRYLGSRGCRLPRLQCPFICTWYLCPTQRLRAGPSALPRMTAEIEALKGLRRCMEAAFVRAVC